MTADTTRIAERMFEVLLDELRSTRPELLEDGFTVAEIYQNLVPYRSHRDRIGVEMNGDYEHALLRLLAGEGGYLEVGSDAARRRFREELESVRPETGIYRKFAAVEVRVNEDRLRPDRDDRASGSPRPDGAAGDDRASTEPGDAGDPEPSPGAATEAGASATPPEDEGSASGPSAPGAASTGPGTPGDASAEEERAARPEGRDRETCRWCRETLPDREDLRFCPYCGSRTDLAPCPECGAELEEDWLFCLACGAEVGG